MAKSKITKWGEWMRWGNSMKWFIVPKNIEQINDYLFIDTYKSNKIKIGVNEMMANDIAKWECDETTKLRQYRRYQSWDSLVGAADSKTRETRW